MELVAKHTIRKFVGKCIYCGSTENLTDEHCIPESLEGMFLLEKASCKKCGEITGKFEARYTRDSLLPVRTAFNMKSKRSKKKRPTEFPMRFIKNGVERIINVPVEDHYSIIPMIEVGAPKKYPFILHSHGLKPGESVVHPFKIRSDEHVEYLKQKYDADAVSVDFPVFGEEFFRMIAKIGYCFIIWKYGLSSLGEVYVLPAILGKSNDVLDWVGSDGEQELYETTKHMESDHSLSSWFNGNGEFCVRVKLFKKSLTPEYIVVVGRMNEKARAIYQCLGFK
jgi:hypothetical protein